MTSLQTEERVSPLVWRIAGVAALGPLITNLDSTVVNVSLSAMGRDLHVPLAALQWVVTGYLLALALMLPMSGWLVDRFGAKRVYLGCFSLFTGASMLCGFSPSANSLIASRILQGMAGGLLAPMAQMMVAREAPRHIARVMGIIVVPVLLGPIFGPTLAGIILQHASWHWIFFINLPIGLCSVGLASWILPNDAGSDHKRHFDLRGFLLISPGLALLLYSLEVIGEGSRSGILALAFAVFLLVSFAIYSLKQGSKALIDLQLFRDRAFASAALTQFLATAISYGGQILVPLLLLTVLHLSPARSGFLLAFTGLGAMASYPSMGFVTERFGARRVSATGAAIALFGTLPFALIEPMALATWMICVALFIRGLGMGAITVPSVAVAYTSMDRAAIPVATTAINIVQRLGGPIATTILVLFLNSQVKAATSPHDPGTSAAFTATFSVLCGIHLLSCLSALRLPKGQRPVKEPASSR